MALEKSSGWSARKRSVIIKIMADWRSRAQINADVVCFKYVPPETEREAREVYLWDLDKTYLDTKFETLHGIFRTAIEKAFQKKNVPGTASLARALMHTWQEQHSGRADFPIYFITASPPQLEHKIYEKLNLDGLYPFTIFCKDNLKNLRPKRLWRLTQQVGFKLQALLQVRESLADDVRLILLGDDSESDAIIYSLFSDICARRLEKSELTHILKSFRVVGPQMEAIFDLQSRLPEHDPVEKIYINLAEDTDAEYYIKFGRRTLPTYNSFQTALDLFQDKRMNVSQVIRVAQDLTTNFGFTRDELERSLDDLIRRQILGEPCLEEILPVLEEHSLVNKGFEPSIAAKPVTAKVDNRVFELEGSYEPWVPDRIDYLHDYR